MVGWMLGGRWASVTVQYGVDPDLLWSLFFAALRGLLDGCPFPRKWFGRGRIQGLHLASDSSFCFHFANHFSQISQASLRNLDKLDPHHIPFVRPFRHTEKAERDPVHPERNLDAHIGTRAKPLPGPQTATLEAQAQHAAMHEAAIAYQQQRRVVIHLEAWPCAPLRCLSCSLFRIPIIFHEPLQRVSPSLRRTQWPPAGSQGCTDAGSAASRPFNRSYSYRSLVVPNPSLYRLTVPTNWLSSSLNR